jgi:hypothetical protein
MGGEIFAIEIRAVPAIHDGMPVWWRYTLLQFQNQLTDIR